MSNFGAYWLGALVGLIFAVALGATLSVVSPLPGDEAPEATVATQDATPAPEREAEPEAPVEDTEAPVEAETSTGAAPAPSEPQATSEAETPTVVAEAEPEPTPAPAPEAEPEPEAATEVEARPETEAEAEAQPETEAQPEPSAQIDALRDHSERYRGDESQPLLSIVLIDLGDPALNIDEIFLLPAPLSVVIDATAESAQALVADARDSGFEALFAVDGAALDSLDALLDDGGEIIGLATLSDDLASPETISTLTDGLTARNMGLFDASNAGGGAIYRAAQAIDLPAAPAGRRIDENPNSEAVYQALERAAFDARRAGAFVVYARPDPVIMTGLRRWMSLKANRSVAVAPLSTVMRKLGRE